MMPRFSQKQRKRPTSKRGSHPRSRANLKPFKPGESGNPGGLPAGTPRLSTAYQKLLGAEAGRARLPVDTVADEIAAGVIKKARQGDVRAAIEIADRTEGKATQRIAGADNGPIPMVVKMVWVRKGLGGEEVELEEDPDKIPA